MSSDSFDIAIIGAGPSGATAAAYLARKDLGVALIDVEDFASETLHAAWLSAKAIPILDELGVKAGNLLKAPISELTFFNADFSKSSQARFDQHAGYLVERSAFGKLIRNSAIAAGATFMPKAAVTEIRLNEADLVLTLNDHRKVKSRLLILATGRDSTLATRVGFRSDAISGGLWTAQVDATLKSKQSTQARVCIVLGLDGGGGFCWCGTWDNRAVVNINLPQSRDRVIEQLQAICRHAFQQNVLPLDLADQAARATFYQSPAGGALDMDTHVAKHTLLVGEAGGFVSAANNEGLYPAMWSAKLAAETIEESLRSKFSQDTLMSFDSKWRMQMVDYLRSPHTDIRFLLPLIFSNQPMADRMGAAFLLGSNM
ncbi:MAG: NAD(P)/FAD-dependent oxidoreductase [Planctomycetes bacterium]|nr:NAD(P)/FAD-dependent oxidoreductase [Planctomycetota bacterium]MBI3835368.1 NAD(P)/FAD-dependent oxidoreductase [Planctomycetota bacterium]